MRPPSAVSLDLLRTPPSGAIECYCRKTFLWYLPLVLPLYRVGRDETNEIRLDDPTVSSRHALLTPFFSELLIEDLDSKNGVRYRGERVARARLQQGEAVRVGLFTLRFVAADLQRPGWSLPGTGDPPPPLRYLVPLPAGKPVPLSKRLTRLGGEGESAPTLVHAGTRVFFVVPEGVAATLNGQAVTGTTLLREGDQLGWNRYRLLFTAYPDTL